VRRFAVPPSPRGPEPNGFSIQRPRVSVPACAVPSILGRMREFGRLLMIARFACGEVSMRQSWRHVDVLIPSCSMTVDGVHDKNWSFQNRRAHWLAQLADDILVSTI
jgi:hypothetical protein